MGTGDDSDRTPDGDAHIGEHERRVMNSRGRELLLRHWDFPLFVSSLRRRGISLADCSVLDAGCGSGYGLTLIWEIFHPRALTGFDILPSQVELARARNLPATVLVGDIASLQMADSSFDAGFVCGVLHHCRRWREGLSELARVLKAGGILLLEEPDISFLRFERMLIGHSPVLDTGFSSQAVRDEAGRNGLAVIEDRNLYFGLFRSLVCVKAVGRTDPHYVRAREVLRPAPESEFAAGQQAPA